VSLAATAFVATLVGAQPTKRFVLTPYVGLFAPSTNLSSSGASALGLSASASMKQQAAFAFGANASYWVNDRVALELGGAYAASDLKSSFAVSNPGSVLAGNITKNARVWVGSAKLMLGLLPTTNKVSLRLGIGPAIVSRGGSAFKSDDAELRGLTNMAGAISLCTKIPITEMFAVRVRAEDFLYRSNVSYWDSTDPTSNFSFDRKFQSDLMVSAGLQISLFR
jgi:hypothetical protein